MNNNDNNDNNYKVKYLKYKKKYIELKTKYFNSFFGLVAATKDELITLVNKELSGCVPKTYLEKIRTVINENENIDDIVSDINKLYKYMVSKKYDKQTIDNVAKIKNSLHKFCKTNNKLSDDCKPTFKVCN